MVDKYRLFRRGCADTEDEFLLDSKKEGWECARMFKSVLYSTL